MLFCFAGMNARGARFGGKCMENSPGEGLGPQQRFCSEDGYAWGVQDGSDTRMHKDSELFALKKTPFLVL